MFDAGLATLTNLYLFLTMIVTVVGGCFSMYARGFFLFIILYLARIRWSVVVVSNNVDTTSLPPLDAVPNAGGGNTTLARNVTQEEEEEEEENENMKGDNTEENEKWGKRMEG